MEAADLQPVLGPVPRRRPAGLAEPVALTIEREGEANPVVAKIPLVEGAFALAVSKDATEAQKARIKEWLAPSK